ncbi:MAG TPA: hypothetical protein VK106_05445, partial [Balneolaceae bacterium]|nr:hypothetical protein [Balneolaceae bacterium]
MFLKRKLLVLIISYLPLQSTLAQADTLSNKVSSDSTSKNSIYIPKNLQDAIGQLNQILSEEQIEIYKSTDSTEIA